ncbi:MULTISPECIES: GNAT family N-acetyltransferase [unclassified Bosea (in: a-proteobacteria)]|uniref:GNAT family N-acetyltransferase n=1 Tax=unclassified Bosea (in: a-proteobacteria) TaxID=2653178 RepID=UPI000F750C93|nr:MULTISPECIES: GNAT family N-acetyltransferase [unclassified Bosea (in: a-proteobacteria)]AZO76423.1 GNAT family N-acetyltransferase [Bosea sp. Tri-49]RXT26351.1 GNAT family N-acetyltransferase [Bosea sp. Tri-39]RXT31591.1 GNAT family N-acetyltransferase [Bosea sp. Tri-54]
MHPDIIVTDSSDESFLSVLQEGLRSYNEEQGGATDQKPIQVKVRDPETGVLTGGISGRTSRGILFIDYVYLPQSLRGSGIGSQILAMAEHEGKRRGCSKAVLFTISFQAPDFYKHLGWKVLGEVVPKPPGAARIYLTKDL